MYEQFYGLTDRPFSLTPNPRFTFYSQQFREVERQLLYGINNREGLMLATGQPGTGKTTLCRNLIEKLDREGIQSALIFNPSLNGVEMLAALLTEFGVSVPPGGTRKELLDRVNQFLLAQLALGRNCVAIFDEAQHLSPEFLEQVRILSNLETDQEKLIQIVFVGQSELLDKIRTPQMAQLDQRVSIRCILSDLDQQETDRYIHHRLDVAGAHDQIRFTPKAVTEIFRASHGVPRLINLICDRALLAGFAGQTRDILPAHVRKAIATLHGEGADVDAASHHVYVRNWRRMAGPITAVVVTIVGAGIVLRPKRVDGPADEILYRQAAMAAAPADAERDLRSLITAYPQSKRYDDALLRLAELAGEHGDHATAIQSLALLTRHTLARTVAAELADGDTGAACRAMPAESDSTAGATTPLVQQFQGVAAICVARSMKAPSTDSPVRTVGDSTSLNQATSSSDTLKRHGSQSAPARSSQRPPNAGSHGRGAKKSPTRTR